MVLSTSSSSSQERLPGARQAPLKRRRSLSQFYFAKSQSFSCMSDLVKQSAFSKSSLLLAKRSSSSNGYEHSFESISEDMSECTSPRLPCVSGAIIHVPLAQQQLPSAFEGCSCLKRYSWDGSSCRCSPDLYSSLQGTLSDPYEHQQQPQLQPCCSAEAQQFQAAGSLSSSSGDMMAATVEAEAEAFYWCNQVNCAADSLCLALQTTSLAAAVATPSGL